MQHQHPPPPPARHHNDYTAHTAVTAYVTHTTHRHGGEYDSAVDLVSSDVTETYDSAADLLGYGKNSQPATTPKNWDLASPHSLSYEVSKIVQKSQGFT